MKSKITKSTLVAIPMLALTVLAGGVAQAATDISASADTSAGTRPVRERIQLTDAQKQTLKEVRALYDQGKTAEAEALAKQAGLPERPQGGGKGLHGPNGEHGHLEGKNKKLTVEEKAALDAKRKAIEAAITANDFATFNTLIAGSPFEGKITEANFAKLVQANTLRVAGDHEGSRAIMKELGIEGHGPRPGKAPATTTVQVAQ